MLFVSYLHPQHNTTQHNTTQQWPTRTPYNQPTLSQRNLHPREQLSIYRRHCRHLQSLFRDILLYIPSLPHNHHHPHSNPTMVVHAFMNHNNNHNHNNHNHNHNNHNHNHNNGTHHIKCKQHRCTTQNTSNPIWSSVHKWLLAPSAPI
jgi:hypothetical protein